MITHEPQVGSTIYVDGREHFSTLLKSDWDQAPFRLQGLQNLACRVVVTGRTYQRKFYAYCVRVRITLVGDGEPDKDIFGWMPCF